MIKAAVIGNPIKHSRSPLIHNFWLEKFNVDGSYEPIKAENNKEFEKTVTRLVDDGYSGFNVTIPYKELAHEICDEYIDIGHISHYPSDLKAANTVKIQNGKLIGYNTDFFGFYKTIKSPLNAFNKNVIILGAGGASRSIAFGLANLKKYFWDSSSEPILTILNRNEDKAKTLIDDIYRSNLTTKKMNEKLKLVSGNFDDIYERIKGCNYIINTTPIGMSEENAQMPFDINCLKDGLTIKGNNIMRVYDIIYNPLETLFLKEAEKMLLLTHNGLGMLIWQAAVAFNIFFLDSDIENFEDKYLKKFNEINPELCAKLKREIG